MRQKLQQLLKSEGLTASRLAEMLEIQPAGISHLIAGRNKPSFDLLQKILRRFPNINPDWLLLDDEQMYRTESQKSSDMPTSASVDLFSRRVPADATPADTAPLRREEGKTTAQERLICNAQSNSSEITSQQATQIDRIVIFYADGSFKNYNPK